MMTIKEHFRAHKITAKIIADAAGVNSTTVSRALCGDTIPGDAVALAVEEVTNGEITAEQFVSHCFNVRNRADSVVTR